MAGKRKYCDLRYMFIRGLQAHERMQRGKHYLKSAAECTSKAIVSLELWEKNVNTAKQAGRLEAIGPETVRRLEGYVNNQVYSLPRPAPGCYASSAGAILVALLNLTEAAAADSQNGVVLIAEEDLWKEACKLSEERFLPRQSPGFCQAWWRLEVLIKRDLVKRRSLHKSSVYHLLPLGLQAAIALRTRSQGHASVHTPNTFNVTEEMRRNSVPSMTALQPTVATTSSSSTPATTKAARGRKRKAKMESTASQPPSPPPLIPPPPPPPLPSTTGVQSPPSQTCVTSAATAVSSCQPSDCDVTDAMYTNDTGQDGVILLVDIQECGGNRAGLAELCELLEQTGMVYRTRKLSCGDYTWLWRRHAVNTPLPVLLERKRADDVAYSLKDGRFWRQISKMTSQREHFQEKGVEAVLQYVIEGRPENFVVRCADDCQGIGRCGNPTLQQVQRVLCDLKQHPHLELIAVDSILDTVRHLAKLTTHLKHRTERGDFDALIRAEVTVSDTTTSTAGVTAGCPILDLHDRDAKAGVDSNVPVIDLDDLDTRDEVTDWPVVDLDDFESSVSTSPPSTGGKGVVCTVPELHTGKNGNCVSLFEDGGDLPPMARPSRSRSPAVMSAGCRSLGQYSPQRSHRQGHSAVPLTTKTGSPRGRVYLMKRNTKSNHDPNTPTTVPGGTWQDTKLSASDSTMMERTDRRRPALFDSCLKDSWISDDTKLNTSDSTVMERTDRRAPAVSESCLKDTWISDDTKMNSDSTVMERTDRRAPAVSESCLKDTWISDDIKLSASGSTVMEQTDRRRLAVFDSCLKDSWVSDDIKLSTSDSTVMERTDRRAPAVSDSCLKDTWISDDSEDLPDLDLVTGPLQCSSLPAPVNITTFLSAHQGTVPAVKSSALTCQGGWDDGEAEGPLASHSLAQPSHKVEQVASIFPQMSISCITQLLQRCEGDVERCVAAILEEPALIESAAVTAAKASSNTTGSGMCFDVGAAAVNRSRDVIDLTD